MIIDVEKLDFGSVITEHTAMRNRTRGIPDGEAMVKFILSEVEKMIRQNKSDKFRVTFTVEEPPPRQATNTPKEIID